MRKILITGGAGFIGSHLVNRMVSRYPDYQFVNLDKLTYAADLSNITAADAPNYKFVEGDITDREFIRMLFIMERFTDVIHLAAESHVDNSIENPFVFAETNIMGTLNLLENARQRFGHDNRFYHVSTDEVYGHLETGLFTETTPYDPRSPYSASKAGSDMLVRAYMNTYRLNAVISNCSNNYGPHQHEEKLIPKTIKNVIEGKKIPVYAKGENVRDWLHVNDHVAAIDAIFHEGKSGETYNIGSRNERQNIVIVNQICDIIDEIEGNAYSSRNSIEFTVDRPGHDYRYAIDPTKVLNETSWKWGIRFEDGLRETVEWYINKFKPKH
jgi:dTDP-glucose 4,6-dehydratase